MQDLQNQVRVRQLESGGIRNRERGGRRRRGYKTKAVNKVDAERDRATPA
jgi:hypothetical protein